MTTKSKRITLTKFDVAHGLLRTAITLWFEDGDPASIHTLACASYEIIHTISKKKNPQRDTLLFDSRAIDEQYRKPFVIALKDIANFFKHADRDPDRILTFDPTLTELFIMCSMAGVHALGHKLSLLESCFLSWRSVDSPELFLDDGPKLLMESNPVDTLNQLRTGGKKEFFQKVQIILRDRPDLFYDG